MFHDTIRNNVVKELGTKWGKLKTFQVPENDDTVLMVLATFPNSYRAWAPRGATYGSLPNVNWLEERGNLSVKQDFYLLHPCTAWAQQKGFQKGH